MASANAERQPVTPREIVRVVAVVAPPPASSGGQTQANHRARLQDKELGLFFFLPSPRLLPISQCDSDVTETRGIRAK